MSLSVGIVGFPNVGKSTLFEILTKKRVAKTNFPFCTIDPNIGLVVIPDNRLIEISKLIKPQKTTMAIIKFIDIAGLIEGASQGAGLGNKFLAHIQETNLILFLLRAFQKEEIINTREEVDPLKEGNLLENELALKDLETIEQRISFLTKGAKMAKREIVIETKLLTKIKEAITEERPFNQEDLSVVELKLLKQYRFLTLKPRIYLLNGREEEISQKTKEELSKKGVVLSIDVLSEYEQLELNLEGGTFLDIDSKSKIDELIQEVFNLLDLLTFFTFNANEVRAWKIKRGTTALLAAGLIHTDFQNNFIKAEVIPWDVLIKAGGLIEARKLGMTRIEGKNYIIKDGDVIEIKI